MCWRTILLTISWYLLVSHICLGSTVCFFPDVLQGQFDVHYSRPQGRDDASMTVLDVQPNSIPVYGVCHKIVGTTVILLDTFKGRNGNELCYRSFQFQVRSFTVIQLISRDLDKCYSSYQEAYRSTPAVTDSYSGNVEEIMLYKRYDYTGSVPVPEEFCAISGKFHFSYTGSDVTTVCPSTVSEMSNCPQGNRLQLAFRGCSFRDFNKEYTCLAHWDGPNNSRYLVLNSSDPAVGEPRFRCAMYREEEATGRTYVAMSNDSSCQNMLRSPNDGYETLVLHRLEGLPWPREAQYSTCSFPTWSQGFWETVHVDGYTVTYRDRETFKTFTGRCIGERGRESSRQLIYTRTQCGDEMFTCVWMEQRSENVMEIKFSRVESPTYDTSQSLCSDANFHSSPWITQSRTTNVKESPCPIAGEYTGTIPDDPSLCAKLYSDCNNAEIMFYQVVRCDNKTVVYDGLSQIEDIYRRIGGRYRRQLKIYRITNPRTTAGPAYDLDPRNSTTKSDSEGPEKYDPFSYPADHGVSPLPPEKTTTSPGSRETHYSGGRVPDRVITLNNNGRDRTSPETISFTVSNWPGSVDATTQRPPPQPPVSTFDAGSEVTANCTQAWHRHIRHQFANFRILLFIYKIAHNMFVLQNPRTVDNTFLYKTCHCFHFLL